MFDNRIDSIFQAIQYFKLFDVLKFDKFVIDNFGFNHFVFDKIEFNLLNKT